MSDFVFGAGRRRLSLAIMAGVLAVFLGSGAAFCQDAPQTGSVDSAVAVVGGESITEADLAFAAEDLAEDLVSVPPTERRAFLLSVLIDMKIMAGAARAAEMDKTEVYARRLKYLEERALRRAYVAEIVGAEVTQEAVAGAYKAYVDNFVPEDEVRARHILVDSADLARKLATQIAAGEPFEALAQQHSTDPGAANGGDLGFFGRGRMVPAFEEAAFGLETGQVSAPVQTQFGWHLIKLEARRKSQPMAIEQVGAQLQQNLLFAAFDKAIASLKQGVEIEIPDPVLGAAIVQQQAN